MRTGGYMVQQALSPEAANVLKQALTLAKNRGHAQVTPLHVAHTMLSFPSGLFRTACLQSHSHPLQCKALELCFNVALNRLPASSSSPVFGCHSLPHPSISNALLAAFKRGQAHQRRGSIESQQQPLLAVKIELDQLIISILDDPSVSRVMQEAGFSSTQVKINVEKAVSLELSSQNRSPIEHNPLVISSEAPPTCKNLGKFEGKPRGFYQIREEDVGFLIENLLKSRRRNIVIVGECVDNLDELVRELMERVDKGDVHEGLKEVKFISLPLLSIGLLSKEEVEQNLVELKSAVNGYLEKGVVLYLGDLKWISEYMVNSSCDQGRGMKQYCHLKHMVMEIGKFCCGIEENGMFSIIGVACFKTYTKCKSGNPSLESIWGLQPITIPDGSLSLGLTHESETGISNLQSSICTSQLTTSSLPSWLLKYKDEKNIVQDCSPRRSLGERTISFNSMSPSCSTNSLLYNDQHPNYEQRLHTTSSHKDIGQALLPYPSSIPDSTSSSYLLEAEYIQCFKELTYENIKNLCTSLEQKVPSQKDIIPEIVTTIVQCRSRIKSLNGEMRKDKAKEETWMCFQGLDVDAKEKIARELARLIFGSSSSFVSITSSSFSCSRANSTDDLRNKRSRDDQSYLERFSEMVCCNPHRVFFLEDIEQVDCQSKLGIKKAIERGSVRDSNGKEVWLSDAIVILSCENFDSKSRNCSLPIKRKLDNDEKEKVVLWDLNISLEDTESAEELLFDDVGMLECLDRIIIFKSQVL